MSHTGRNIEDRRLDRPFLPGGVWYQGTLVLLVSTRLLSMQMHESNKLLNTVAGNSLLDRFSLVYSKFKRTPVCASVRETTDNFAIETCPVCPSRTYVSLRRTPAPPLPLPPPRCNRVTANNDNLQALSTASWSIDASVIAGITLNESSTGLLRSSDFPFCQRTSNRVIRRGTIGV